MENSQNTTPDLPPEQLVEWMVKLEKFFDDIYNENGKIDFPKALHVASYTIGRVYSLLNRNIFQQRNILAEMEQKYDSIKAEAIKEFKHKMPLDLGTKQEETYIQGDQKVSSQFVQVKKQKNLIEYLERLFSQATFYNGNLKNLIESYEKANRGGV